MNDFIAYRDADTTLQEYERAKKFHVHSNEPYDFLEKSIGGRVWMIIRRRARYHLTQWFTPADVVRRPDGGCEIIGVAGVLFEPPFDLTSLPWFQELFHERDHFSSDFEPVNGLDIAGFYKLMADRERKTGSPLKMSHASLEDNPPTLKFPISMMIYCNGCGKHFDIVVNSKEAENHRCPVCGAMQVFGLERLVQKAIEQSKKMPRKPRGRL